MYGAAPSRPEFWAHLAQGMVMTLAVLEGPEVLHHRHELRNVWAVLLELEAGGCTRSELLDAARRVVDAHAWLTAYLREIARDP